MMEVDQGLRIIGRIYVQWSWGTLHGDGIMWHHNRVSGYTPVYIC